AGPAWYTSRTNAPTPIARRMSCDRLLMARPALGAGSVCVRVVRVRQPDGTRCCFRAGDLLSELPKPGAEVHAVAKHIRCAVAVAQQERQDRLVRLESVAALAGENQVVAPVVGALAPAGRNVVQRDHGLIVPEPAVRAHRAVLLDEPDPGGLVRVPVRRKRCKLRY